MTLTRDELARIEAQAIREYPRECCGVVLVRDAPSPGRLVFPCRNRQDELHASDPDRHPRDGRTAYHIHDDDLLAVYHLEVREQYRINIVYHSHIEVGAYFSETDKRSALMGDGTPIYPDVAYVVMSVVDAGVAARAAVRWDAAARDFLATELRIL